MIVKASKFQKVNLTDRKVILKKQIRLQVNWEGKVPEIVRDTLAIDLDGYPTDALVRIDAQHRNESHEFYLGTVGDLQIPEEMALPDTGFNKTAFFVRVVDRDIPGRLYATSRAFRVSPQTHKINKKKSKTKILLNIVSASLDPGVPYEVRFPEIEGSGNPVEIAVNHVECPELYHSLVEHEPLALATILPGCISNIAQRVVLDAVREKFDVNDPVKNDSSWQTLFSHELSSWTSNHLQDIDLSDASETDEWISEILSSWSTKSGNPALVISRSMGGLK